MTTTLDPADQLAASIRQVVRGASKHGRKLQSEHGVTPAQLEVLKRIHEDAPVSAGALAKRVDVGQATMTRLLDRLEQRGFIRRERDVEDRRRVLIRLEPTGTTIADSVRQPLNEALARKLGGVSEAERTRLLAATQRLVVLLGAEDLDSNPLDAAAPNHRP